MSKRITELPTASSVSGDEKIPLVQAGSTKQATASQIAALGSGNAVSIRGRNVATTTPKTGAAYVWDEAANEFKPKKGVAILHADDFGAVADDPLDGTGTDNASAIEAAIAAIGSFDMAGEIIFSATPDKAYRCSRTINVPNTVKFRGQGGGQFYGGTAFIFPPGVTGFRLVPYGAGTGRGLDTIFEDIAVLATGKATNTVTATYTAGNLSVPVSAASDFVNGQLVEILGVGNQIPMAFVYGSVTNGTNTVTLECISDAGPALRADHYIKLGAAYPNPTRITSVNGLVLTMESNAAATVNQGQPYICAPMLTKIVSGGGTTTWTIDNYIGQTTMSAKVRHADAGFDIQDIAYLNRCSVGDPFGHGFAGPAYAVRGDHACTPASNTNCFGIVSCKSYACRYSIFTIGVDANAGWIANHRSLGCTDWCYAELSFLGNTYIGCHADSGNGFLSAENAGNCSVFLGCYTEVGTYNNFGFNSHIFGGVMGRASGGFSLTQMGYRDIDHLGSSISGNVTYNAVALEFYARSIQYVGTLSANATLTFAFHPFAPKFIWNNTTGGFSLLVKCATGNTVTIPAGQGRWVFCTGTEIREAANTP